MEETIADEAGDGSAGNGVGTGIVAAGPGEMVGDGVTALGEEGVHAATVIAINPTARPDRPRGTTKTPTI